MHRRSVLSVVAATFLAGCGWGQETRRTDEPTTTGASNESDGTPEPLPESEAGETLLDRTGEELLLPVAEFREWTKRDGWEEQRIQSTYACRKFKLSATEETIRECKYCTIVAEDEDSAIDDHDTFASISETEKVLDTRKHRLEKQDVGLEIGDEAVVHQASLATREDDRQTGDRQLMTRIRVVFRDANAVGLIDYKERTWAASGIRLQGPQKLADLAVRLHKNWREQ